MNQSLLKIFSFESKDYLLNGDDDYWKAISFYVVNKCSFSGLTESSSFSKMASENNFTMRSERLPFYSDIIKKWVISNYSYDYLLKEIIILMVGRISFILIPPYAIKDNLYGRKGSMHKSFDHDKFAKDCSRLHIDALVSYNSDQMIKDRFEGWTASEYDLTYTLRSTGDYMKEQHKRKELLLFNYGTEGLTDSINFTKQNLLEDDENVISEYPPIINRCLSGHLDCVLFANEMNKYHFLTRICNMNFI